MTGTSEDSLSPFLWTELYVGTRVFHTKGRAHAEAPGQEWLWSALEWQEAGVMPMKTHCLDFQVWERQLATAPVVTTAGFITKVTQQSRFP